MMTPTRTDEWLADFLSGERILVNSFPTILDMVAEGLTSKFEQFKHLPEVQRTLTLAFAGFSELGPFAATVSNHEDDQGKVLSQPEYRFRTSMSLRNDKQMRRLDMAFHGAEAAITSDKDLLRAIAKIRRALFQKPGDRIATVLVAIIRRAAKNPAHGHLISPHCVTMVHSAASGEISCDDHFSGQRRKKHLPHYVTPLRSFKHIWVQPQ